LEIKISVFVLIKRQIREEKKGDFITLFFVEFLKGFLIFLWFWNKFRMTGGLQNDRNRSIISTEVEKYLRKTIFY
jgi:hypothetical protein